MSPEIRVDCELRHLPEDTHLMNLVLIESMDRMINFECKANCEACQVNSDSQFDHCRSGNCLDEDIDHTELYAEPARNRITEGFRSSSCRNWSKTNPIQAVSQGCFGMDF